ncbi:hypothetical protein J6590_034496 [Homalodisca vitripennis]|nr:hypothetical protein J6590_034496 [Homalodisca vitripennis]
MQDYCVQWKIDRDSKTGRITMLSVPKTTKRRVARSEGKPPPPHPPRPPPKPPPHPLNQYIPPPPPFLGNPHVTAHDLITYGIGYLKY